MSPPLHRPTIKDGKPAHSLGVILQKYPMAATCGRVCVRFCEMACRRNLVDEAVGIKILKRYVADQEQGLQKELFSPDLISSPQPPDLRGGPWWGSGPAGISCAYHPAAPGVPRGRVRGQAGRPEAWPPAASPSLPSAQGGAELGNRQSSSSWAVRILCGQAMGRDFSLKELFDRGYKAVFLAPGMQPGAGLLGVADEDVARQGYVSGIDFSCCRPTSNAGGHPAHADPGRCRGGRRRECGHGLRPLGLALGAASSVHLVYRRTKEDMPADHEEVEAAEKEGVVLHCLTNPVRILAEGGRITGVEIVSHAADRA